MISGFSFQRRLGVEELFVSKEIGDALITAQKIEEFIEKVNKQDS